MSDGSAHRWKKKKVIAWAALVRNNTETNSGKPCTLYCRCFAPVFSDTIPPNSSRIIIDEKTLFAHYPTQNTSTQKNKTCLNRQQRGLELPLGHPVGEH